MPDAALIESEEALPVIASGERAGEIDFSGLTPKQQKLGRLIAEGWSDQQACNVAGFHYGHFRQYLSKNPLLQTFIGFHRGSQTMELQEWASEQTGNLRETSQKSMELLKSTQELQQKMAETGCRLSKPDGVGEVEADGAPLSPSQILQLQNGASRIYLMTLDRMPGSEFARVQRTEERSIKGTYPSGEGTPESLDGDLIKRLQGQANSSGTVEVTEIVRATTTVGGRPNGEE